MLRGMRLGMWVCCGLWPQVEGFVHRLEGVVRSQAAAGIGKLIVFRCGKLVSLKGDQRENLSLWL